MLTKCFDHELERHVGKRAMVMQVFHVLVAIGRKLVKNRIAAAVEIEWLDLEKPAESLVKCRGRFDPFTFDKQVGVTMKRKIVTTQHLEHFRRRQVVCHVGKTQTGGNSLRTRRCREQNRFWYTEAAPGLKAIARFKNITIKIGDHHVIHDKITHRIIERYRLFTCADNALGDLCRVRDDIGVVRINCFN